MVGARVAASGLIVSAVLAVAACGASKPNVATSQTPPPTTVTQTVSGPKVPSPGQFLATDAARHSVTVTLIAAYDGENGGFNFDGYSRFLMWTVPRGWRVPVICKNRGPLRHSCAVVDGATTTTPAFKGAAIPQPVIGLEAGTSASFTFRATRVGVYRFVCLVPGHEAARMWDVLQIVRRGKPSVVDLQAR